MWLSGIYENVLKIFYKLSTCAIPKYLMYALQDFKQLGYFWKSFKVMELEPEFLVTPPIKNVLDKSNRKVIKARNSFENI